MLQQSPVKDGVRCSTANAYLRPAMQRPNLTVITQAMTRQIILDGKRAVGVSYDRDGQTHTIYCKREVLICAGPIGSPHLLQRSGIGPAAVLSKAGVEVLHDLARIDAWDCVLSALLSCLGVLRRP